MKSRHLQFRKKKIKKDGRIKKSLKKKSPFKPKIVDDGNTNFTIK